MTSGSPLRFQCFRCAFVSITGRARAAPTRSAVGLSSRRFAITAGSNDVPCGAWCAPRRTPRSALRERVTIERPNIGWGRADVR